MNPDFIRPRLVLVTTLLPDGEAGEAALRAALSGGDVASVIIGAAGRDEATFQRFAEPLVDIAQSYGAAAIIADDSRCAGRTGADGLHLSGGDLGELKEAMERFSPKLIVGCSGFTTRHEALEAGELMPDYVLFGALSGDTEPSPQPKDAELAEWWAAIVEVPAILMGGADIASLAEAAASGAEFVALSRAVFAQGEPATTRAQLRVEEANSLFDALAEAAAT